MAPRALPLRKRLPQAPHHVTPLLFWLAASLSLYTYSCAPARASTQARQARAGGAVSRSQRQREISVRRKAEASRLMRLLHEKVFKPVRGSPFPTPGPKFSSDWCTAEAGLRVSASHGGNQIRLQLQAHQFLASCKIRDVFLSSYPSSHALIPGSLCAAALGLGVRASEHWPALLCSSY